MESHKNLDLSILYVTVLLLAIGLVVLSSASVPIAEVRNLNLLFFTYRQSLHIIIGLFFLYAATCMPIKSWGFISRKLMLLSILLLVVVLIPQIGRSVNGSRRWLAFGGFFVQVSEIAKLAIIIYVSKVISFTKNNQSINIFIAPISCAIGVAILLLLEPDYGTTVVIMSTILILLFLAEAPLGKFTLIILAFIACMAALLISSPYRVNRLISFLNPWQNQFGSGYQLTQSLIAFGKSGWLGAGLGNGLQKMLYLPEAHTDFILAVLVEELGIIGYLFISMLYFFLVMKGLTIGKNASENKMFFHSNIAYGISICILLQTFINFGVSLGLLPTKGITLPLISYGGSSIVVSCILIGIVIRVDYETKCIR